MTDAEIQELRVEIAHEFACKCINDRELRKLDEREQEYFYKMLGIGMNVAAIAMWKVFNEGRFEIGSKTTNKKEA